MHNGPLLLLPTIGMTLFKHWVIKRWINMDSQQDTSTAIKAYWHIHGESILFVTLSFFVHYLHLSFVHSLFSIYDEMMAVCCICYSRRKSMLSKECFYTNLLWHEAWNYSFCFRKWHIERIFLLQYVINFWPKIHVLNKGNKMPVTSINFHHQYS